LDKERYMILKMLEEGKISAEEAAALLEALEQEEAEGGGGEDEAGPFRDRPHTRRRHCFGGGFDREAFRESMDDLRRNLEKVRLEATEIGDEVSRQVRDAIEAWAEGWRQSGRRPFRHFVRHLGDVFSVPFGREAYEETFEQELEVQPGEECVVSVKSLSGDIEVETWERDAVRVVATKKVWAHTRGDARERAGDYVIYAEREGREVRIGAELAEDAPGWLPARCTIDYDIKVPEGVKVEAVLTNGDLSVAGVRHGVRLRSTNGEVRVRNVSGPVDVTSTNGDISLRHIEARYLLVKSVNGDVTVDLVGLGPGDHDVTTIHGDIDILLGPEEEVDLQASTMHGDISLGLPGAVASRTATRLRARLGRRAEGERADRKDRAGSAGEVPELSVRAVFGDICLRAREEG